MESFSRADEPLSEWSASTEENSGESYMHIYADHHIPFQ